MRHLILLLSLSMAALAADRIPATDLPDLLSREPGPVRIVTADKAVHEGYSGTASHQNISLQSSHGPETINLASIRTVYVHRRGLAVTERAFDIG